MYLVTVFILILQMSFNEAFNYNKCRQNVFCGHEYIWDKNKNNYISLLNETLFKSPNYYHANTMENATITVLAHNFVPYITCENKTIGGFVGSIWNNLQEAYKVKQTIHCVDFNDGILMVQNGEADVILTTTVVQEFIMFNAYYTQPYYLNWYQMYMKAPKRQPSSLAYLKTFTPELWGYTWVFYILLTLAIWLTLKILRYIGYYEPSYSIVSCYLGLTAGIMNQGLHLDLRSISSRMQLFFALMFGVVLYSAMNATLFSRLTVFEIPFPFKTIDDVAVKGTHSMCLRENSFVILEFMNEEGILPKWKHILNNGCPNISYQENISNVLCHKEKHIVLENSMIMSNLLNSNKIQCRVATFENKYYIQGNVFAMKRSFQGRHAVNNFMNKLRSFGILARLQKIWGKTRRDADENKDQQWTQVTIDHTIGILCIYICFIFISLNILLVEIIWHKFEKKKNVEVHTRIG